MKLKQRVGDFRVRELLRDGYLGRSGDYRVYRVSKRKLTTPEAVGALAREAGVEPGEIGVAGWKDRQGITIQYMSVRRGRPVRLDEPELKIDTAGFADEALSSEQSRGNAFEVNVRALRSDDLRRLRGALPVIREHGLVNYFDDQRFGNLVHGQGWIAKDLMLGEYERALRTLLTARSPHDDDRRRRFKQGLQRAWGDWRACRDVAGRFGAHHSVFEHLAKNAGDFAGAFTFVASRVRLIHLYAWQSHVWNRAVVDLVRAHVPAAERLLMECEDGLLVTYAGDPPPELARRESFRLPGAGLEDVTDRVELDLLEDVLARERMVADRFRIEGVSGFGLKGEERRLIVRPEHLRVRPAEPDPLNRGARMVRIRFELPRGSYASLVVKRLLARSRVDAPARDPQRKERRRPADRRQSAQSARDRNSGRSSGRGDRRHHGAPGELRPAGARSEDRGRKRKDRRTEERGKQRARTVRGNERRKKR